MELVRDDLQVFMQGNDIERFVNGWSVTNDVKDYFIVNVGVFLHCR